MDEDIPGLEPPEIIVSKIEIEQIYIPEYPLLVYKLPSGSPGHYIEVHEDPYEGVSVMVVEGELNEH